MNVLSLFTGIGGIDLGLERAGMTIVAQVEIDPFCQKILRKHWPLIPLHDDVRTFREWWKGSERPTVDLVCGGFPCQPFSEAGKRKGVLDERWAWPWMFDVVRCVRPKYVLIENVHSLIKYDAFTEILRDLHSVGFDAEWDVVSACSLGAPHMRKRLFILAYAESERERVSRGIERTQSSYKERDLRYWETKPEPHRVVDGVSDRVDRNKVLGNAVVPQVAQLVGEIIADT